MITDERLAEIAAEAVQDAIKDLMHDRMGQAEQLGEEDGADGLSEAEQEALCDRYEAALKKHLDRLEPTTAALPAPTMKEQLNAIGAILRVAASDQGQLALANVFEYLAEHPGIVEDDPGFNTVISELYGWVSE